MAGQVRWEYLAKILKDRPHKTCAEIGIWRGKFTFFMLENLPGIKLYHCVDLWKHYEDHTKTLRPNGKIAKADMNDVYKTFKKQSKKFGDRIKIHRMKSVEAAETISDDILDFIFIDANHAYEYVKEDIEVWYPKVKPGGIISGHDYNNKRFGVTEAVHEKFKNVKTGPNMVWWTVK